MEEPTEQIFKQQQRRIRNLELKLRTLQTLIIAMTNRQAVEFKDPYAEIFPVVYKKSPTSRKVVLAFGGLKTSLGMPPTEFLRTFVDKDINVFFLKDLYQCWYQTGLMGISDDVESTVEAIQNLTSEYDSIFTVGTSGGGFAAILFGVSIGARKIIAFGPQTNIAERPVIEKFKSLDTDLGDLERKSIFFDLRQVLESTDCKSQIEIHYGRQNDLDREAAEYLSGFETVTLHGYDTESHNIARWLKQRHQLDPLLDRLIAD